MAKKKKTSQTDEEPNRKKRLKSTATSDGGDVRRKLDLPGGPNPSTPPATAEETEAKRREKVASEGATWGILEVLKECGLSSLAPSVGDGGGVGCELEFGVRPTSFRASVQALLSEMDRNGTDAGNARVVKSLEELIASGRVGEDEAPGDEEEEGGAGVEVLRRMLLPMTSRSGGDDGDGDKEGSTPSSDAVARPSHPPLIKVLLRVDALQPPLLAALLQKLPEFALSDDDDDDRNNEGGPESELGGESDVPRLVLSQIRWLDHVVDPAALTSTMLECLTALTSSASASERARSLVLDIVSTLPDVVDDCPDRIESVAATLRDVRTEDPTLLLPVLDALSSLRLDEEQVEAVTNDALEALHVAEPWALPTLCKFLMQTVPGGGESCNNFIESLRRMRLGAVGTEEEEEEVAGGAADGAGSERGGGGGRRGGKRKEKRLSRADAEALTLEALARGMQYRSDVSSALLSAVRATPPGRHPPSDVWLLLCCAVAPHNRTKVRSVFRAKSSSGAFTEDLLQDAVRGNGRALGFLFRSSALTLADGLVRSPEKAARDLGGCLYRSLYLEFPDPIQRQEIVGSLVTHVGSGSTSEVDAAMGVFSDVVRGGDDDGAGPRSLKPFSPFLTSLLDHLQQLNPGQVRSLFLLLFAVGEDDDDYGEDERFAGGRGGGGGGRCDDVHIVIRKHLSLSSIAMKRIGIIGAVAFAVSRSSKCVPATNDKQAENTEETCLDGTEGTAASSQGPQDPAVMEIVQMLEMAYLNCRKVGFQYAAATLTPGQSSSVDSPGDAGGPDESSICPGSALAFLFDELGYAVQGGRLARTVVDWTLNRFSADLEDQYLGEFVDEQGTPPVGSSSSAPLQPLPASSNSGGAEHIIDPADRALVVVGGGDGRSSANPRAPGGEMRFNIDGPDALVYLRILPLVASSNPLERSSMMQQLCPLVRLLATCHDVRYGGAGLGEIDAVLGCPVLLPKESDVGIDFEQLHPTKQWTATASTFYATCWVRELINVFIHSAAFPTVVVSASQGGSTADESQAGSQEEIRTKVVERLKGLVQLEEDLRFTASKCLGFAPLGMKLLPPPKELIDSSAEMHDGNDVLGEIDVGDNASSSNNEGPTSSAAMTKDEKKALAAMKKAIARKAAARAKSKQKLLKLKSKHASALADRAYQALRPLRSFVCLALGFPELSVMGKGVDGGVGSQIMSLGASQLRHLSVGGPITNLLLARLHDSLTNILAGNKTPGTSRFHKGNASEASNDLSNVSEMDVLNNAYVLDSPWVSTVGQPPDTTGNHYRNGARFQCLDMYLAGGVFASMHEHLAAVAEIRGGRISDADGVGRESSASEDEREGMQECICLLFSCLAVIVTADQFTSTPNGRGYLAAITKQLSEGGDRDLRYLSKTGHIEKHVSLTGLMKNVCDLFDLVEEILMGGDTDDLLFVMRGVDCLAAVHQCAVRLVEVTQGDKLKRSLSTLGKKLSELCHRLLQREWAEGTKYNKGNVGRLATLYIELSFVPFHADGNTDDCGRMKALTVVVKDVLGELPNTNRCRGPVNSYPTCCLQSFGTYFSAALAFLPKELTALFDSSLGKDDSAVAVEAALGIISRLVDLFGIACDLTKDNPTLVKKPFLLTQLRGGTKFMEIFVSRAVPFLQLHFQQHETAVVAIITETQHSTRQLGNVIAHGKREKDPNLAKETPRAKKVLESFIHKIKGLMRKNRCLTALWGGNLKIKYIDGSLVDDDHAQEEEEEGGSDSDSTRTEEEDDDEASDSENEYETDED